MLDIAHHPITRRIALSRGFRKISGKTGSLSKVALGEPITQDSWRAARLRIERLSGLVLQKSPPTYEQPTLELGTEDGKRHRIPLFELESLLSPTVFALPKRHAVIVPITKDFAAALLETEAQLSFLDVPEAQFLSRRTYFNTIRAAGAMTPGAAICFYESVRSGGRGSIVAIGRIVDVMAVPTSEVPEALRRGAVVENLGQISKASRVLATTIDNLLPLPHPVTLRRIKDFGCVTGANLVTATRISAKQLEEIVLAGFSHAR